MKKPWMKFYPRDWRSDVQLRLCSGHARALWIDMIGLMHEAEPYGHLTMDGRSLNASQLAKMTGDSPKKVRKLLAELEEQGVFSLTENGIIYCRRMVRDHAKAEQDTASGRLGGNPSITRGYTRARTAQSVQNTSSDIGRGVNPQSPEARVQRPEINHHHQTREQARDGCMPGQDETAPTQTQAPARAVTLAFLDTREKLWPDEAGLPAPMLTIDTQAQAYLDGGVSRDVLTVLVVDQCQRFHKSGRGAPASLAAFNRSLPQGIERHRTAAAGKHASTPPIVPDAEDDLWRGRAQRWITEQFWPENAGPPPDQPGTQVPLDILQELGLVVARR